MHGSVEQGNLVLRDQSGNTSVLVPGLGDETAGTRQLPSGDWVVVVVSEGTLLRVEPDGGAENLLSGLSYPNGVEVTADGYVSENSGGRVRRVHSETGEDLVVAEDLVGPNGLVETADGEILYVGTCPVDAGDKSARVYALQRTGPDSWEDPVVLYETERQGCIDGIAVDACGRIYFADYGTNWGPANVHRLHDDGTTEFAADTQGKWIPNMRWGPDIGGWGSTGLYASDRQRQLLYAMETNLPGKPHVHR
ncbi:MAG: hypothetical protein GY913_23650 [Proteobacteria bacterium]|nr:hypothetical protein [Pseudomonadota bacterium]MCP4919909.1 hypothetical protein [Pseudomonadota bacterium]